MNRNKGLLLVIGGVLVLLIIFILSTYNSLVGKEENLRRTWGDLNTVYQRRNDLIPSLVSTVKASSDYERTVLVQLAEARAKAAQISFSGDVNIQDYQNLEQSQGEVVNAVNRTLVVVENYPDLKAGRNFLLLQSQLEGTERRIKFARRDFNAAVAEYNKSVRRFPGNIVAGMLGFRPKEGFSADRGAEQAPEINFKK